MKDVAAVVEFKRLHRGARGAHSKRKLCCCGGHSAHDAKSNPHHHSTRARLRYRQSRILCLTPIMEAGALVSA
jgi:hypothetical protein